MTMNGSVFTAVVQSRWRLERPAVSSLLQHIGVQPPLVRCSTLPRGPAAVAADKSSTDTRP